MMVSKMRSGNRGFTLVEMMVALAILSGLGLVAAKILEMIETNSKTSERKEAQLSYYLRGVHVIDENLRGLRKHQFDPDLFYRIRPDGDFEQNSAGPGAKTGSQLTNRVPSVDPSVEPFTPLTSFVFQKKMGIRTLSYTAVCIPLASAWNNTNITYASISKNALWPFVRKKDNAFKVFCCPRGQPMCTNNVLTKNPTHTVQIYRHDPVDNKLTPLLKKNEYKAVSGLGYFLFSHKTNDTALYARFFVFYNECVSQTIMRGSNKPNCSPAVWFKTTELLKEFAYVTEGVNNLGGEIGI
jgi:prepilin-type N-terminal cleavage/methylation domain-containing protein